MTEHLRMSGIYWGLTALHLLGHPDALPREGVLKYVISCLCDDGGFAAAPGHDSHMLYTVSAVQLLATLDAMEEFEQQIPRGRERVGHCAHTWHYSYLFHADNIDSHRGITKSREWYFCW